MTKSKKSFQRVWEPITREYKKWSEIYIPPIDKIAYALVVISFVLSLIAFVLSLQAYKNTLAYYRAIFEYLDTKPTPQKFQPLENTLTVRDEDV